MQLAKKVKSNNQASHTWMQPQTGWIKCNSDCRFIEDSSSSAFLVRNCNGSVLLAHAKEYFCANALVAELYSIRDGCLFFSTAQLDRIIFESDSLNAIMFINEPFSQVHWIAKQLVEEIRRFWALWSKWRFKYCSRFANAAAHSLAHWSFAVKKFGYVHVNFIPISCFCDGGFPLVDTFPLPY